MVSTKKKTIIVIGGILAAATLLFIQKFVFTKASNEVVCHTRFSQFGDSALLWEVASPWGHKVIKLLNDKARPFLEDLNIPQEAVTNQNFLDLPDRTTEVGSTINPLNRSQEFLVFRNEDKCGLINFAKEYKARWGFGMQDSRAAQDSPQCMSDNSLEIFKGGDGRFYMYDINEITKRALKTGISYGECKEGKKNGIWKSRHSITKDSGQDVPFLTSQFDNGKPVGVWTVQSPSGKIVFKADMEKNPTGFLVNCDDLLDSEKISKQESCNRLFLLRTYPDEGGNMTYLKWKNL